MSEYGQLRLNLEGTVNRVKAMEAIEDHVELIKGLLSGDIRQDMPSEIRTDFARFEMWVNEELDRQYGRIAREQRRKERQQR